MKAIHLIKTDEKFINEIEAFKQECLKENANAINGAGSLATTDVKEWIKNSLAYEEQKNCKEGYVSASQFLLLREDDNKILGSIQVRHYLNDFLKEYGGHIGYTIVPSERKKGYATFMLKEAIKITQDLGIQEILITCDEDNTASKKTILNNGGIYLKTVQVEGKNKKTEKYLIKKA